MRRAEEPWAAAALVALALAGFGFLLVDPASVATPHSDLVTYHLAMKQALYDSLHAGRGLPFWRSDQLSGAPAYTNPQAQFFQPLHFLFWLVPAARAFAPVMFLTLLCGAFSTWTLAGTLGLRGLPRLLPGAVALFSMKAVLAVYAGWLGYLSTVALLPLLFAAVLYALERPGPRAAALVAVAAALCLHTAMLQLVCYALYFCAPLALSSALRRRTADGLQWLALGGALGAGLAAHWLLPFLAELALYSRGQLSYAQFIAGAETPRHLLTLALPDALGTPLLRADVELWERSAHFGVLALSLALLGIAATRRRPFLAIAFALCLLLSFDTPLLHALFAALPGVRLFRIPTRILFLAAMFGACLAGFGLRAVLARARFPRALGVVAILVVAAEGTRHARSYLHGDPDALEPHPGYAQLVASPELRTAPAGRATINAGWSESLGLQLATGYDPLTLRHYSRYFALLASGEPGRAAWSGNWTDLSRVARWDLLDALSVGYLVVPASAPHPRPWLKSLAVLPQEPVFVFYSGMRRAGLEVLRNENALPRARFVERVVAAADEDGAAAALRTTDARGTAVVEGTRAGTFAAGRVALETLLPGEVRARTSSPAEGFLLVSEVWHPGWSATIDGRAANVERADLALLGLWVPAGEHQIALRFRPLWFPLAIAITAIAAIAIAALFLWARGAATRAGPYQSISTREAG